MGQILPDRTAQDGAPSALREARLISIKLAAD
jgi:hypothetical protein